MEMDFWRRNEFIRPESNTPVFTRRKLYCKAGSIKCCRQQYGNKNKLHKSDNKYKTRSILYKQINP